MTRAQNTPEGYEQSAFLSIPVNPPHTDTDMVHAGPSNFIGHIIRQQAAALFPDNGYNHHITPEIMNRAVEKRGEQIQAGENPGNYPQGASIAFEETDNVVSRQVHARLNASQIVLSETTNLPDVAGKVVLSDVLRKFVDKETPAQLIARLEKMGLVIDDEIITAVTRTYNDKISKNTPPAPIEIDHVNRVASWLAEKANGLHDYALGIDQPTETTNSLEVLASRIRESIAQIIPSTQNMLDDALHAGVELYLSISAHTDNVRRLLLHRIRTLREEHVDHLFGPLDAASKVVKETPIERPAPLLTRALKFVRKKVTAILEEQSKAPEEGFRKRLAQILTGKPIPRPTFTWKHKAKEEDWPEKFLANATEAIESLRKRIPHLRPAQLRILLGFVALTDKPDNHDAALGEISKPVAGEILKSQNDEGTDKPVEDDSAALEEWRSRNTPEEIVARPEMETREEYAASIAQETENRLEYARTINDDVRRRRQIMLAKIEARRRLKIQQAGGVDPDRRGYNQVLFFEAKAKLEEELERPLSDTELFAMMNEYGMFA